MVIWPVAIFKIQSCQTVHGCYFHHGLFIMGDANLHTRHHYSQNNYTPSCIVFARIAYSRE
jgi:hypothetical protein